MFPGGQKNYSSASRAVVGVIDDIVDHGDVVGATMGSAVKASAGFTEVLGHSFVLSNPLDRMYQTDRRKLNLSVAVARFVWMMSGSNRLADIAFYEPKVLGFSDDGYSVPGSSYGQRIFQSSPGIDQLRGIIERIKSDPNTRRATVSIYQPSDATRVSKDIPCTFGLMYHPRNGALNAMTIMRSNNAGGLLEFNLFEFSLLAEVVAAEAGLELGQLLHFAGSMHVFGHTISSWDKDGAEKPIEGDAMRRMPRNGNTLRQLTDLIKFESEMRHQHSSLSGVAAEQWIGRVQSEFEPFWQQFAFILLLAVARKNGDTDLWEQLRSLLSNEYRPFFGAKEKPEASSTVISKPEHEGGLFGFEHAPKIAHLYSPQAKEKILSLAEARERKKGVRMSLKDFSDVEHLLMERIAARGLDLDSAISEADFEQALEELSGDQGKN